MSDKENPFKKRLDVERIYQTASEYFEYLSEKIRNSIEKIGLTGESQKTESNRLIKTIMGFDILSSIKTNPDVIAKALNGVPESVLRTAENRLMAIGTRRTKILDLILKGISIKLGRDS